MPLNCLKYVLVHLFSFYLMTVVTRRVVCVFTRFLYVIITFFLQPKESGPFVSGRCFRPVRSGGRTRSVDIAAKAASGPGRC